MIARVRVSDIPVRAIVADYITAIADSEDVSRRSSPDPVQTQVKSRWSIRIRDLPGLSIVMKDYRRRRGAGRILRVVLNRVDIGRRGARDTRLGRTRPPDRCSG